MTDRLAAGGSGGSTVTIGGAGGEAGRVAIAGDRCAGTVTAGGDVWSPTSGWLGAGTLGTSRFSAMIPGRGDVAPSLPTLGPVLGAMGSASTGFRTVTGG